VTAAEGTTGTASGDGRLWEAFGFRLGPEPDGRVGLCAACRRLGHCRLGITEERLDDDGHMHARLSCPVDQDAGPGGVAHGGWVAAALDEILGRTIVLHGHLAVTGTLTVRFVRPVPVERPLLGRAQVTGREGRRWLVAGELVLASTGAVLAIAEGTWVERDGTHYDRHREWLAEQDRVTEAVGADPAGADPTLSPGDPGVR
jgi:acyl-coenzyme A thioesterase PaaI-like protein